MEIGSGEHVYVHKISLSLEHSDYRSIARKKIRKLTFQDQISKLVVFASTDSKTIAIKACQYNYISMFG